MHFTKMQGLGNDYLYVYGEVPENIAALSQKLSDRHFGAGADGMIYKTNLVAGNEIIKKPYWIYNSLISLAAILVIIMILSTVRKSKIRKAKRARRAG